MGAEHRGDGFGVVRQHCGVKTVVGREPARAFGEPLHVLVEQALQHALADLQPVGQHAACLLVEAGADGGEVRHLKGKQQAQRQREDARADRPAEPGASDAKG